MVPAPAGGGVPRGERATIETMNWQATFESGEAGGPDPAWPALVQALWYESRGDWDRAHDICNEDEGKDSAWVHAFLHRVEGDLSNADYWYRRAGRRRPDGELAIERAEIATALASNEN